MKPVGFTKVACWCLGLWLLQACAGPKDDSGRRPVNPSKPESNLTFKIIVSATDGGWEVQVKRPTYFQGRVDYPGVSALRVNGFFQVDAVLNDPDASSLTLTLTNGSPRNMARLWLLLRYADPGLELATEPDAENGNTAVFTEGEPLFVFGPLLAGAAQTLTVEFNRPDLQQGYLFTFDILEISDRLVFSAKPDSATPYQLVTIRPDGTGYSQVTDLTQHALNAAFAPGGERIAFTSLASIYDIWTVHPDGSHLTQVTNGPGSALHVAFSPDGKTVVYDCTGRSVDSTMDICLNDIQGGAETVLINGFSSIDAVLPAYAGQGWYLKSVFNPTWSPDGTKIVFEARHPVYYSRYYYLLQEMDPVTKTPIGNPIILNRPANQGLKSWITVISSLKWGPDSRHAVFDAIRYTVTTWPGLAFYPNCPSVTVPASRCFMVDYDGPWLMDLDALTADLLPGQTTGLNLENYAVRVSQEVSGLSQNPTLSGDQVFFNYHYSPVWSIVSLPHTDYAVSSTTLKPLVNDEADNSSPSFMPPLLAGFYR